MKQCWLPITVTEVLLTVGCSSEPDLQRVTLRCKDTYKAGGFIGFYSFTAGELTAPSADLDQVVDLAYYFDGDDCSQGVLIGHDDHGGYLFPVGHKSWSKLAMLAPPSKDTESVEAIAPLTKDKEGLAFWVKTEGGEYLLAKIKAVQPASYADLVSGVTPAVELEWTRPLTRTGDSKL